MNPELIKYLKYAHEFAWDQHTNTYTREGANFWENEAHDIEHMILELDPEWIVGT